MEPDLEEAIEPESEDMEVENEEPENLQKPEITKKQKDVQCLRKVIGWLDSEI